MNTVTVVKPIIHLFPLGPCSPGVFFHNPSKFERPMSQIATLLNDHFISGYKILELLGLETLYEVKLIDETDCHWQLVSAGQKLIFDSEPANLKSPDDCMSIELRTGYMGQRQTIGNYLFVPDYSEDLINPIRVFDIRKQVK